MCCENGVAKNHIPCATSFRCDRVAALYATNNSDKDQCANAYSNAGCVSASRYHYHHADCIAHTSAGYIAL